MESMQAKMMEERREMMREQERMREEFQVILHFRGIFLQEYNFLQYFS